VSQITDEQEMRAKADLTEKGKRRAEAVRERVGRKGKEARESWAA
jgi:hypothetical protein